MLSTACSNAIEGFDYGAQKRTTAESVMRQTNLHRIVVLDGLVIEVQDRSSWNTIWFPP